VPLDDNAPCTVCIPTYNQAEYLRAAVHSVAAQTAPVRLLVSNDASPDNTAEVLAELQRSLRFQAVNHTENRGISENLQWLLHEAQTPLIVRLDSDDLLHPDYVKRLSGLLEQHSQAGYAHCAIQEIGAQGEPLGVRRLARAEGYQDAEAALRRSVQGYQVSANVVMFRRDALASVQFGAGAPELNFVEDYDLSVRLADSGWGNVYASDVLASYRMWSAGSRPVVGRKQREVEGVRHIFTGSLTPAFQRRGWSLRPLQVRRWQLALANAEILDRAAFTPAERASMVRALTDLSGSAHSRWAFGPGFPARSLRRGLFLSTMGKQAVKRRIKAVLARLR
jgi:glycosyltransferase involved in cell wall biosynthesis